MMSERGLEKTPGCSSIEVNGDIFEFTVRDGLHVQSDKIRECLIQLARQMGHQDCFGLKSNDGVGDCIGRFAFSTLRRLCQQLRWLLVSPPDTLMLSVIAVYISLATLATTDRRSAERRSATGT
ncbi:hypothetical protein DM860_003729 [Cuscuta australis]|uniref:Uncharacterized protein n=1 Tax=Cuscuta australis TaxID=267555 RepID=A0A328DIE5_9ASTE|nr:hypothetical protein DM860_003729 [Cuscuta australis]